MKIGCVIPAYNEEKTIVEVINAVKDTKVVSEIIVVSDGSTDATAEISRKAGIRVIENAVNMGKGAAVSVGIKSSSSDVILFLDADLIGLRKHHITELLRPVIENQADMTIGIFSNGRMFTDLAQKIAPNLSGQRAVKRSLLLSIDNLEATRYGVEIALTRTAKKKNMIIKEIFLKDMTHIMKEEKLGFRKGVASRIRMYMDILKSFKTYGH